MEKNGVAVLTHNQIQGDRTYIIYTLEWDDGGVIKAYTGRASVSSITGPEPDFDTVFRSRYKGDTVTIRVDDPSRPGKSKVLKMNKSAVTVHERIIFRHENPSDPPTGVLDSKGKRMKQPGDLAIEGLERHFFELDRDAYGDDNMLNRQRWKITNDRTAIKKQFAEVELAKTHGRTTCPLRP